jgi:hypothetical protein
MVWDALWRSVMGSLDGHLCPLCLEARLGRPLKANDFTSAPINWAIVPRLIQIRKQGRESLLAEACSRRDRLDRRAARRRELRAEQVEGLLRAKERRLSELGEPASITPNER